MGCENKYDQRTVKKLTRKYSDDGSPVRDGHYRGAPGNKDQQRIHQLLEARTIEAQFYNEIIKDQLKPEFGVALVERDEKDGLVAVEALPVSPEVVEVAESVKPELPESHMDRWLREQDEHYRKEEEFAEWVRANGLDDDEPLSYKYPENVMGDNNRTKRVQRWREQDHGVRGNGKSKGDKIPEYIWGRYQESKMPDSDLDDTDFEQEWFFGEKTYLEEEDFELYKTNVRKLAKLGLPEGWSLPVIPLSRKEIARTKLVSKFAKDGNNPTDNGGDRRAYNSGRRMYG